MKIGPIEMRWHPGKTTVSEEVLEFLRADPRVIQGVARVARGEVKNYLAELGESAEMPFNSPENFLAMIRTQLAAALLAEQQAASRTISIDELERRREQAKRNMKLVDGAFEPDLADDDTWTRMLNNEPFPGQEQNMVNLNATGFVSDAELEEAHIRKGEN